MASRKFEVPTKIAAVRMMLAKHAECHIRETLGATIPRQAFERWLEIYQEARRALRDPRAYEAENRNEQLSNDERELIIELVRLEPGLFGDLIAQSGDEKEASCFPGDFESTRNSLDHQNLIETLRTILKKPPPLTLGKTVRGRMTYAARIAHMPAEYLVFTDESEIRFQDLRPLSNCRNDCGSIAAARIRVNRGPCTLFCSIGYYGLVSLGAAPQPIEPRDFEKYLQFILLPRMNRYPAINSVLVMDRASIHMGLQVPKLCDRAGVKLIYLPLKSPHLNPLQSCISMIKRDLRRSRSLILERDPIWMIRRRTCDIIDDQLCRKVFKQAGLRCPPDTVTDDDAKSNISGSE